MSESIRHPLSFYESAGEIELGRGDVISTIDLASFPGSYPVYSSSAVGLGEFGRYGRYMFDEELITWSIDGGGRPFHRKKHRFSVTNVCGFLRIKRPDLWDYRYLHALLEKLQSGVQFDYQMKAHPSVIRELYQFERAPIAEQRKIGQILDTLDTAIHETEALIDKLKAVKQGLLHDLLTRGIDANGQLRPPQSEAPQLYKESPLGWIPREWVLQELGNLAEVSRGKFTHRPRNDPAFFGGEYPFIQTGDVALAQGGYISSYSQTLSERGISVSQEFPAGTIAITIAANIADTAILARSMFFPDSVVGAMVAPEHNIRFVELSIRRAKRTLDARAPQSAQKNINLQDLRPLLLAVPSRSEQDAIATRYDAIQARLEAEQITVDKLRQQKSGLMDDLLTGRVRVTPLLESMPQPDAPTEA